MNKKAHGGPREPGPGKKMGRPPKGSTRRKPITLNIDAALLDQVDALASQLGLTRSDLAARGFQWALKAYSKQNTEQKPSDSDSQLFDISMSQTPANMTPEELVAEWLTPSGHFYTDAELTGDTPPNPFAAPPHQANALSLAELDKLHAQTLANESFDPDAVPPTIEEIISDYQKGHLPLTVPPLPPNWPSVLKQALVALNNKFKARGLHGGQQAVKSWIKDSRGEELKRALLMLRNSGSKALVDLITHCALDVGRAEVLAWAALDETDRITVLWHLAFTGKITPADLGDVGTRFEQAKKQFLG